MSSFRNVRGIFALFAYLSENTYIEYIFLDIRINVTNFTVSFKIIKILFYINGEISTVVKTTRIL